MSYLCKLSIGCEKTQHTLTFLFILLYCEDFNVKYYFLYHKKLKDNSMFLIFFSIFKQPKSYSICHPIRFFIYLYIYIYIYIYIYVYIYTYIYIYIHIYIYI